MKKKYEIQIDPLAISLTKPATKLGVPFLPFFSSVAFCMFGWLYFQGVTGMDGMIAAVLFIFLWLVIYALMYLKSKKDVFGLIILTKNLIYFRHHKTQRNWDNTDSYTP